MADSTSTKGLMPKLVPLKTVQSQLEVENFWHNLLFQLSGHTRFSEFMSAEASWKTRNKDPNRGLTATSERTQEQAVVALEYMLGTVSSYIPVLTRTFITNQATSLRDIYHRLSVYYGFNKTGGQVLDLCDPRLQPDQSYEAFWEQIYGLFDSSLVRKVDKFSHNGELIGYDEKFSPTILNLCVITWLRGINPSLPSIVKQQYAHHLRNTTIFSIREEISENLSQLLRTVEDVPDISKVQIRSQRSSTKAVCCLCQAANRNPQNHYFQKCPFLPTNDRKFLQTLYRPRVGMVEEQATPVPPESPPLTNPDLEPLISRVNIEQSPRLKVYYKGQEVSITLDYGAEANLASLETVQRLGIKVLHSVQGARQVDGSTPLQVVGEANIFFTCGHHTLSFDCLVVKNLTVAFLGGVPFHSRNDIHARTSSRTVWIKDCCKYEYLYTKFPGIITKPRVETTIRGLTVETPLARIMRVDCPVTILPGETVTCSVPSDFRNEKFVAIEPRLQAKSFKGTKRPWLEPSIAEVETDGKISIVNSTDTPIRLGRHEQICNIRRTSPNLHPTTQNPPSATVVVGNAIKGNTIFSNSVFVDSDNHLSENQKSLFHSVNQRYDEVFNPEIGLYNGASGPFKAVVNIGPTLPPQRKGRCPQYAHADMQLLQQKFDELCDQGIFATPESLDITVEYLNPSFLVRKLNDQGQVRGHRLVTSFGEVAQYAKPQPSLLPRVDETLRYIGRWTYIIKTDLSNEYFQIPLSGDSIKFCGVSTPFKGIRAYTRCAMGMPGSETALEELMTRVLGTLLAEGSVVKLADDLYCGASTPEELVKVWEQVLAKLHSNGLRLSAPKTVICPTTTTILGWIWKQGTLAASPHRVSALQACDPPNTVHGLKSFLGTYRFLSMVIPSYCDILQPLEAMVAGRDTKEKIVWTDEALQSFETAKRHLNERKSITIPRTDDQLRIVTDASKIGIAATLYVVRNGKPLLAGFFNAKLRLHHGKWLPCEIEALSIGMAITHFRPYIIQSRHITHVLTDSRPCVQAYHKLCRGEFSSSARVVTFLSALSNHGAKLEHIKGKENCVSDYASRNPISCENPSCQVCRFVAKADECVVRSLTVGDVNDVVSIDLFTSRNAWKEVQRSCPTLSRVHAHLRQGTRPPKKKSSPMLRDVRRYLEKTIIARDGLLVAKGNTGLAPEGERIVVPRSIAPGIATAIHLKLNHPSRHQLQKVLDRQFFALKMADTINEVHQNCSTCTSLRDVPTRFKEYQSTKPEGLGLEYSADVIRRCGQYIMFVRENVSAYSQAVLISNERAVTLRDNLLALLANLRTSRGPRVAVRVDAASGFRAIVNDEHLHRQGVQIVIGREKNPNKNSIAERGIREVHAQLRRLQPMGGVISPLTLSLAIENVNSELRNSGLSAREIWTQRNQFTNDQLPISDQTLIKTRHDMRLKSHKPSAKFAARGRTSEISPTINVGSLVYLIDDRDKTKARDRYLVVEVNTNSKECTVQKFVGKQLRSRRYTVRLSDCFPVKSTIVEELEPREDDSDDESSDPGQTRNDGREHNDNDSSDENSETGSQDPHSGNEDMNFEVADLGRPRRAVRLPSNLRQDYVLD